MQLRSKLILIFLLVSLVPIIGMSGYFFYQSEKSHREQVMQDLGIAAQLAENNVRTFFSLQETRLNDWSSDGYIRSEMEKLVAQPSPARADALGDYIRTRKMPLDTDILVTDILDLNGRVIVSTDPTRVGEEEGSTLQNFEKAKSAGFGHSFIEPMEVEESAGSEGGDMGEGAMAVATLPTGEHFFHVLTPLVSLSTDATLGVMLSHLDFKTLDAAVAGVMTENDAASEMTAEESLEVYVLARDTGLMLTSSRYVEDAIFTQKVDTEPVRTCVSEGKDFTGMYENYVGKEVIGSSDCHPGDWWMLIIEVGDMEVMANYDALRMLLVLVVALTAMLAVGLAFAFARPLLGNIDRILQVLGAIGKGNFDARVETVGSDEIAYIGGKVNSLAESLKILLRDNGRASEALSPEAKKTELEKIRRIREEMERAEKELEST